MDIVYLTLFHNMIMDLKKIGSTSIPHLSDAINPFIENCISSEPNKISYDNIVFILKTFPHLDYYVNEVIHTSHPSYIPFLTRVKKLSILF